MWALSGRRGRGEIRGLLDKLGAYANLHFGNEEDCMTKYNCPVAAQNVEQHRQFIGTFKAFAEEYERTGPTAHLTVRLQNELLRWLATHITRTDTQLAPCVRSASAA